jgi:hypothetical protein
LLVARFFLAEGDEGAGTGGGVGGVGGDTNKDRFNLASVSFHNS